MRVKTVFLGIFRGIKNKKGEENFTLFAPNLP